MEGGRRGPEPSWAAAVCQAAEASQTPPAPPAARPKGPCFAGNSEKDLSQVTCPVNLVAEVSLRLSTHSKPTEEGWAERSFSAQVYRVVFKDVISPWAPTPLPARVSARRSRRPAASPERPLLPLTPGDAVGARSARHLWAWQTVCILVSTAVTQGLRGKWLEREPWPFPSSLAQLALSKLLPDLGVADRDWQMKKGLPRPVTKSPTKEPRSR